MHFMRVIRGNEAKLERREYDPGLSQQSSTLPRMRRPVCLADIRAPRLRESNASVCKYARVHS